jgi:hypothetical protein
MPTLLSLCQYSPAPINLSPQHAQRVFGLSGLLDIQRASLDEPGIKQSSAQLTDHCRRVEMISRQVLCVFNFVPRNVAGMRSEVLAGFHKPLANGSLLT